MQDWYEKIEQEAMSLPAAFDPHERAQVSVAISLKRIADTMESQRPQGSILYWLEMIASATNAGRS
jgi:hypothetical protein